jgi:cephalosporin-C deacetylase-like acetyl esterase
VNRRITAVTFGILLLVASYGRAEDYAAGYQYDAKRPLEAVVGEGRETTYSTVYEVRYTSANKEKVPALLWLPKGKAGPHPVVIYQHGYMGSKSVAGPRMESLLVPQGFAIFAIDAVYHGDRKKEGKDMLGVDLAADRAAFKQTVIDLRRAIDYLQSREDIAKDRIGYIGESMGGILGGLLMGVEPRVKTAALIVAGGDWGELFTKSAHPAARRLRETQGLKAEDIRKLCADIDPVNLIGNCKGRPVLLVNGEDDTVIPKSSAERLQQAAQEPKEVRWMKAGHLIFGPAFNELIQNWFAQKMK